MDVMLTDDQKAFIRQAIESCYRIEGNDVLILHVFRGDRDIESSLGE